MNELDGYLKSLAAKLRWRRLDEETVESILREVAAASSGSGRSPVDEFGTPADYAQRFDKGSAFPRGFVVGNVLAGLALVGGLARSAAGITSGGSGFGLTLVNLVVTLALVIGGMLLGQAMDRRLPRRFHR
jgi:hypothetical protein